jgi:adenylosuccinate synthase
LTKVDVLNDCETIKICTAYKYVGPDYQYGSSILKTGCKIDEAIILSDVLEHCQPIYQEFPGWKQSLKGISTFGSLPSELRQIIDFISLETGMNPRIVSTGPERSETIFV